MVTFYDLSENVDKNVDKNVDTYLFVYQCITSNVNKVNKKNRY